MMHKNDFFLKSEKNSTCETNYVRIFYISDLKTWNFYEFLPLMKKKIIWNIFSTNIQHEILDFQYILRYFLYCLGN